MSDGADGCLRRNVGSRSGTGLKAEDRHDSSASEREHAQLSVAARLDRGRRDSNYMGIRAPWRQPWGRDCPGCRACSASDLSTQTSNIAESYGWEGDMHVQQGAGLGATGHPNAPAAPTAIPSHIAEKVAAITVLALPGDISADERDDVEFPRLGMHDLGKRRDIQDRQPRPLLLDDVLAR